MYDESVARLSNRALDAELTIGDQRDSSAQSLLPIMFRFADLNLSLTFQSRESIFGGGHSGEPPLHITWRAGDLSMASLRGGAKALSPETLGEDSWQCLETTLIDGLYTYQALKRIPPPSGPFSRLMEFFHLNGGYVAGRWCHRFFCSLAPSDFYPASAERTRATRQEVAQRTLLPSRWRFEAGPVPCIVREQTEDMLMHEGSEEIPFFLWTKHRFRYRGRFGDFVLPVTAKPVSIFIDRSQPLEWNLDYVPALRVRSGEPRVRRRDGTIRDAIAGEARLSESQWLAFNKIVVEGLLSWPAGPPAGPAPLWLNVNGGYREGEWVGMLLAVAVVGPNAEATGLFIAS